MHNSNTILKVENLTAGYGNIAVLHDVSLNLQHGECLGIIGQNGSGKSTLLKTLGGLLPTKAGQVWYQNNIMNGFAPHKLVKYGISYFVQGGLIIPALTVQEHIELALMQNCKKSQKDGLDWVFTDFPKLKSLKKSRAGNLSGGERHMLSFCILLAQSTKLWMLDEPTAGLAPEMVLFTADFLYRKNRDEKITMLLIEHNMDVAFRLASHIAITKEETLTQKFDQREFSKKYFLDNNLYN